jgi:hypothetical protein
MRLTTGLLALALALPSLAFAAGKSQGVVAPTTNTWKATIPGLHFTAVPARTLNSAKFANFRANPKNYLTIQLVSKAPKGAIIEGGAVALVGEKVYGNKVFREIGDMGRTMWQWANKPEFLVPPTK